MGVLDDIKNSVSGSDNQKKGSTSGRGNRGGKTGRRSQNSSGVDFEDSFGSDQGGNSFDSDQGNLAGGRSQGRQGNSVDSRGRGSEADSGNDFPNPQAGRPQQGSDSPQLSNNTKKKIENAGLTPSNNQQQSSQMSRTENKGGGRNSKNSNDAGRGSARSQGPQSGHQSATRDDIEDLKAQNQQMIELLKRINQSLNR